MKKTRQIFVWMLASIFTASISALVGVRIFNSEAIRWVAVSILCVTMINGICHVASTSSKKAIIASIINVILVILVGALIGMLHILPWWAYGISILVCIIFIGIFIFGFTGHENGKAKKVKKAKKNKNPVIIENE